MYRSLSMYPKSADQASVDDIVKRSTIAFKQSPGFLSCTTSVGALMGPGARNGDDGCVVIVDFETLDDALSVVQSEGFQEIQAASDLLEAKHLLFECREI